MNAIGIQHVPVAMGGTTILPRGAEKGKGVKHMEIGMLPLQLQLQASQRTCILKCKITGDADLIAFIRYGPIRAEPLTETETQGKLNTGAFRIDGQGTEKNQSRLFSLQLSGQF
jgi:hypothetical protein